MNLPDSNFLPAPLWIITSLHLFTLTLHFAAMNFVLGGIVAVLTSPFPNRWADPTVRRFVALFPTAMAVTVTLGVAPLLFLQVVYPAQVYSASIVSGWFWLMVVGAVILAYSMLYAGAFASKGAASPGGRYLLPALAALVYVSLTYSAVFSLAERPAIIGDLYRSNQAGLAWNPRLAEYGLRWLHMVTGAVTVAGFFLGVIGREDEKTFAAGKKLFMHGMGAAALVGLIYLGSLRDIMAPLMRSPVMWVLTAGIVLAFASLHFFYKRAFVASGLALFVSMLSMVLTRHEVRILRLGGTFDPAAVRVAPQWSVFAVFLVSFVVALAVVAYMLRLFFARGAKGRAEAKSA